MIVLSARGEEEDRLVGLETGADDYVVKPFSPREVVLQVEAYFNEPNGSRACRYSNSIVTLGPVRIDSAAREARRSGRLLALTMKEFDLLTFLARQPRRSKPSARRNCYAGFGAGTSAIPPGDGACTTAPGKARAGSSIRRWC